MKETSAETFDFSGGVLCLDFTNTLENRTHAVPRERIKSYNDLVSWSLQAHLLTGEEGQMLLDEAELRPDEAARVLKHAIDVRETLYRIFSSLSQEKEVCATDHAFLNAELGRVLCHMRLVPSEHSYQWKWEEAQEALDSVLWPVVRSAAELLTSEKLGSVRSCAAYDCQWLFLDTSKNQSRRWCDMKSCGNRSKVKRFHERNKQYIP